MGIVYREDPNLEFLLYCSNEDLKVLVEFLIKDKNGEIRFTESLTAEARFKSCGGKYQRIWDLIAGELQLFGADSIATALRGGKGVLYKEILEDVCKRLKVNYNPRSAIAKIEQNLLFKIIEDSLENMTDGEKREFAEQMNLNISQLSPAAITGALQIAIQAGGFTAYKLSMIVANSVAKYLTGTGLSLAVNSSLARGISVFAGPIGWVFTGILTLPLITGPAYRVTIPSVIQIAYMRQKYLNRDIL